MICNMLTFMCCQAGHLLPLNADDASMFTASECTIQDHVRKYKTKAAELKDSWISFRKCCMTLTFMCAKLIPTCRSA